MRNFRLTGTLQPLRQSDVHLNNFALVPASLLPFNAEWRAIANRLTGDQILIVLPSQAKQQRVAHSVASHLRGKGQNVRVIGQELQQDLLRSSKSTSR